MMRTKNRAHGVTVHTDMYGIYVVNPKLAEEHREATLRIAEGERIIAQAEEIAEAKRGRTR